MWTVNKGRSQSGSENYNVYIPQKNILNIKRNSVKKDIQLSRNWAKELWTITL